MCSLAPAPHEGRGSRSGAGGACRPPIGLRSSGTTPTSMSAGRASAGRRRRSTSATAFCSSATTTTSSRSDREMHDLCAEIGCELETWPSSRRDLPQREALPVQRPPSTCCATSRCRRSRASGWGSAPSGCRSAPTTVEPYEPITIRDWVERVMGKPAWEHVWGPLLCGKFRDQADDISMSWLWAKLRNRRQVTGEEAKGELLVYPKGSFESIFVRLRDLIEQHGGRVLIDRPAAQLARDADGKFLVTGAAPRLVPARATTRASSSPTASPERYDAVIAALPSDIFEQLLDPDLAAEIGDAYLERTRDDRVLRRALPAVRDGPAVPSLLLDQRRRHRPRLHRPDRADQPRPARALRRPPLRSTSPTTCPRDHELLDQEHGRADRLLRARPAQGEPRSSRATGSSRAGCSASPRGSPSCCPTTATGCLAYRDRGPGPLLANTTQVYPDDRGTNYAVREAEEVVAQLLAENGHEAPSVRERFGVPALA